MGGDGDCVEVDVLKDAEEDADVFGSQVALEVVEQHVFAHQFAELVSNS